MKYKQIILTVASVLLLAGCMEVAPAEPIKGEDTSAESTIAEKITETVVGEVLDSVIETYKTKKDEDTDKGQSNYTLVRIIDGDTGVFSPLNSTETASNNKSDRTDHKDDASEVTARFLLIDTAEMRGDNGKPEELAQEAKDFTKSLLENASEIRLETDVGDKTDHYGRLLCYVFADGKNVQEELLKVGLAKIAYVNEPNTRYLDEFKVAEEYAKTNGLGLWGNKTAQRNS